MSGVKRVTCLVGRERLISGSKPIQDEIGKQPSDKCLDFSGQPVHGGP